MSEMVERLEEIVSDWMIDNRDALENAGDGDVRTLLRRLLEALREPTRGMVELGSFQLNSPDLTTFAAISEAKAAYRAMIDAVLNSPPLTT